MKKVKISTAIIASLAGLAALSSCCRPFDDFHGLPDYSYFRTGIYAETFTADSSSPAKTVFEYRSWAEAATKMRRAEITLTAAVENVNTEVRVESFDPGEGVMDIDYRDENSRRDQDITVTESTMFCRLRYQNFTLEYRLPFERAFYNDGKTSGRMAGLVFGEDITDNGYSLTDLESEVSNGQVFMRKLFRHSITVSFNGKRYRATATVVLKRLAGNEGDNYVTGCELLDSGIKDLTNDGNHASYTSWIKVRQHFADGSEEEQTFEVLMYGIMSEPSLADMDISRQELVCYEAGFDDSREHVQNVFRNDFVEAFYYERLFVATYNQGTTETLFRHVEAVYNDGFSKIEFPSLRYENVEHEGSLIAVSGGSDEHGSYGEYEFTERVNATFADYTHSSQANVRIFLSE